MARVTVEDCIDKVDSPYELVLVAKERATQLNSGLEPSVPRDNDKNTVIALREIADESITIDEMKNNLIEEYQTVSLQNEEDLTIENIDSQESSSDDEIKVEDEVKIDSLEVDSNDSSESTIEEISYKQDDPDENNKEFSTETDQPTED